MQLRFGLVQSGLSHREVDVIEHLVKGWVNRQIATALFIEEKTVKFHLTNIYKKLGVTSRLQLMHFCLPYLTPSNNQPTAAIA